MPYSSDGDFVEVGTEGWAVGDNDGNTTIGVDDRFTSLKAATVGVTWPPK